MTPSAVSPQPSVATEPDLDIDIGICVSDDDLWNTCHFCTKHLGPSSEGFVTDPYMIWFCDSDCLHAFVLTCESLLEL